MKNFDAGAMPKGSTPAKTPVVAGKSLPASASTPVAPNPRPAGNNDGLLDVPGAYSSTNSAPVETPLPANP